MKKIFIALVTSLIVSSSLGVQPLLAAPDATVGAGFGVIGPPTVTVSNPDTAMYVLEEQAVTVHVEMPPGTTFGDLFQLDLSVYYDSDGIAAQSEMFKGGDSRNYISWQYTPEAGFSVTPYGSWNIGILSVPSLLDSVGDFQFFFAPGYVARETQGTAKWQFAATAVYFDPGSGLLTGWDADDEGATMDLYTEIASYPDSVNWGNVSPGMEFGDGDPSRENIGTFTIVSNGLWELSVRSAESSWGGLSALGDPNGIYANEFLVGYSFNPLHTMGSFYYLGTTSQAIGFPMEGWGEFTVETGLNTPPLYFWLRLHSTFESGLFNGNIVFSLSPMLK